MAIDRVNEADEFKQKGNECYAEKRYNKAIDYYTKSLEAKNSGIFASTVYGNRAQCFINLGRYEEALRDANEALDIDNCNGKIWLRRCTALYKLQMFEPARMHMEHYKKYFPGTWEKQKMVADMFEELTNIPDLGARSIELTLMEKGDDFVSTTIIPVPVNEEGREDEEVPSSQLASLSVSTVSSVMGSSSSLSSEPATTLENVPPPPSDIAIPAPPTSYTDFMRAYCGLKDIPIAFGRYFAAINPRIYARVLSNLFESEHLAALADGYGALYSAGEITAEAVVESMMHLSQLQRFGLTVSFLDGEEKKKVYAFTHLLPEVSATTILNAFGM